MRLTTSKTNDPYTLSSPEKFVRIMKVIMFEIRLKQPADKAKLMPLSASFLNSLSDEDSHLHGFLKNLIHCKS
jgi:hypothetical protein